MIYNSMVHFEIPAKSIVLPKEFYSACFNWIFERTHVLGMEYWLIETGLHGETIDGGMNKNMDDNYQPRDFISVDNFDISIGEFKETGSSEHIRKMEIPIQG